MDVISELLWKEKKQRDLVRAYKFSVEYLKTPLNLEEFERVWYSENDDKKGQKNLYNMCMSIFQSRKSTAGNSFEKYLERLFEQNNIKFLLQHHVDIEGNIFKSKPKKSVHKLDFIITYENSKNIRDCIIVSVKTKLRERWRQDLDQKDKCIKLIYVTKEIPSSILTEQIVGYNTTLVYPNAKITENIWPIEYFISRLQHFQKTGSYNLT